MSRSRRKLISVKLPLDPEGYLERQCPECRAVFAIRLDQMEGLGLQNLRCPSCRLIWPNEDGITGPQQEYAMAVTHHQAMKAAEDQVHEMLQDFTSSLRRFNRKSRHLSFRMSGSSNRPELGGADILSPFLGVHFVSASCVDCSIDYRVEKSDHSLVCPVCR